MERYLIDELIHKAECHAAINNFRLTHYLIRDVYYPSPSLIRSIAFRVHSLPAHEYIGEILVPTDKFKDFDETYIYFASSFDKLMQQYKLRSYKEAASDLSTKNPYKETLYKLARNGGKRAMHSYSDILWVEKIEKVIFNDPATIVFWRDGSKTVVKAQTNETFDPEKGFAMAIAKKALGNEGNYYETFKKFLPKE